MRQNRDFGAKTVATLALLLSSVFVLGSILVSMNLQNIVQSWGQSFQVSVYFDEGASPEEIEKSIQFIKSKAYVSKVDFIDQKKSFELFKGQMASYAPELFQDEQLISTLPLSATVDFKAELALNEKQEATIALKTELQKMAGIEDVTLGGELFARYTKLNEVAIFLTWSFTLLVLILAFFAMSNLIGELVRTRKEEVAILELFGASQWRIRKQFYIEALTISMIAATGSLVLLALVFTFGLGRVEQTLGFLNLHQYLKFFNFFQILIIAIAAPSFGLISAHLSLRRLNSGWAAAEAIASSKP